MTNPFKDTSPYDRVDARTTERPLQGLEGLNVFGGSSDTTGLNHILNIMTEKGLEPSQQTVDKNFGLAKDLLPVENQKH